MSHSPGLSAHLPPFAPRGHRVEGHLPGDLGEQIKSVMKAAYRLDADEGIAKLKQPAPPQRRRSLCSSSSHADLCKGGLAQRTGGSALGGRGASGHRRGDGRLNVERESRPTSHRTRDLLAHSTGVPHAER